MAEQEAAGGNKDTKKFAGAIVFFVAAVAVLIYRMPKSKIVEAHADKPRPQVAAEVAAAAPAPAPPRPKAAAPTPPPPRAAAAPQTSSASSWTMPAAPADASSMEPTLHWEDACLGEIGILCYKIPVKRQPSCLRSYDEVLRQSCLQSLNRAAGLPDGATAGQD